MRIILRVAFMTVLAVILVYAADAAWVWLQIRKHRDPTRNVQVNVMLAIPLKNNRIEFAPGDTETQSCVRALFPHLGLEPCWYLERHTRKVINF